MTLSMVLTALAWLAAALSAGACYSAYRSAQKIRSLLSLQGAIEEAVDCANKALSAVRRVEGRQTALLRSGETPTTTSAPDTPETPGNKLEMRAKYAHVLMRGKPSA